MRFSPLPIRLALPALALIAASGVWAQPRPQSPAQPAAPLVREDPAQAGRTNQRIERIHHEDAGSRVDEVRAGGETKSITVQPKAGVPAYEVEPVDATGSGASSREAGPGAAGKRVWKVLRF